MTPWRSRPISSRALSSAWVSVSVVALLKPGEVDQRDIALALVGHGGRDDAAAPHLDRQLLAAAAQHGQRDRLADVAAQLVHDVGERLVEHHFAVDRHDLVADRHAGLGGGRAVLHRADQDPLVVGALDRDADAAAAVALEAVVLGLVGVGVAAVLVELPGGGDHRALDQGAALALLQHRRGVDRGGEQLGQHAAPGAAVGRVGRRRPRHHLAAVAQQGEGPVAGLQRQRRVGAGEAPVGLLRHLAEIGFVEMAVADRPVGLEDDPFDADIGRRGRAARRNGGTVARRDARGDQGSGEESCRRMGQRDVQKTNDRHLGTPHDEQSSTSLHRAASQGHGERSRPSGVDFGAAIRCAQRSAMTAPLMRGSKISAIMTDSGNHSTA